MVFLCWGTNAKQYCRAIILALNSPDLNPCFLRDGRAGSAHGSHTSRILSRLLDTGDCASFRQRRRRRRRRRRTFRRGRTKKCVFQVNSTCATNSGNQQMKPQQMKKVPVSILVPSTYQENTVPKLLSSSPLITFLEHICNSARPTQRATKNVMRPCCYCQLLRLHVDLPACGFCGFCGGWWPKRLRVPALG